MAEKISTGSDGPGRYGLPGGTGTGAPLTLQPVDVGASWNLQGNPRNTAFVQLVAQVFGVPCLPAANAGLATGPLSVFWLGPTSWLLLAGSPVQPAHPLTAFKAKRDEINRAGGALFDVTASRVALRLSGSMANAVLASGCPLNLHPRVFPPGSCAQSLFGPVGALYLRHDGGDFTLMVARSLAREVWAALCDTAAHYGYEVLAPAAFR